jgi:hypothetical protein
MARYCLGRPGWRGDLREGLAIGRSVDPLSYAAAVSFGYFGAIPNGVLRPDAFVVREIEDALRMAERSGDDLAVANVQMALAMALAHCDTASQRDRGQQLLAEVGEVFVRRGHNLAELPIINVHLLSEKARREDWDYAIPLMHAAVDDVFREGRLLLWGPAATGVLVETLLDHGTDDDLAAADAAIERLAATPADDGVAVRDIWLLRLQGLLAQARGDDVTYRDLARRYRSMAESLGFEGHIDFASAMIEAE